MYLLVVVVARKSYLRSINFSVCFGLVFNLLIKHGRMKFLHNNSSTIDEGLVLCEVPQPHQYMAYIIHTQIHKYVVFIEK